MLDQGMYFVPKVNVYPKSPYLHLQEAHYVSFTGTFLMKYLIYLFFTNILIPGQVFFKNLQCTSRGIALPSPNKKGKLSIQEAVSWLILSAFIPN